MRRCPLNNFEECIRDECPFYNRKFQSCLLPRALLGMIQTSNNTQALREHFNTEKELSYERTTD